MIFNWNSLLLSNVLILDMFSKVLGLAYVMNLFLARSKEVCNPILFELHVMTSTLLVVFFLNTCYQVSCSDFNFIVISYFI